MMTPNEIVRKLVEIGGKEWKTSDGRHRVYFNDLPVWYGLELAHYRSGNISHATEDGERISNTQARKLMARMPEKLYYDVTDGKFHWIGRDETDGIARTIIGAIRAKAGMTEPAN
jgi:hypothetical protein